MPSENDGVIAINHKKVIKDEKSKSKVELFFEKSNSKAEVINVLLDINLEFTSDAYNDAKREIVQQQYNGIKLTTD